MLNFTPVFITMSLWTTYTLSIEPQKAVGDEDCFVSTLFQMSSLPGAVSEHFSTALWMFPSLLSAHAPFSVAQAFPLTSNLSLVCAGLCPSHSWGSPLRVLWYRSDLVGTLQYSGTGPLQGSCVLSTCPLLLEWPRRAGA